MLERRHVNSWRELRIKTSGQGYHVAKLDSRLARRTSGVLSSDWLYVFWGKPLTISSLGFGFQV